MKKKHVFILLFIIFIIAITLVISRSKKIYTVQDGNIGISIEQISNMIEKRAYHQSSLMENGNILITGGYDSDKSKGLLSTEIFDVKSKKFIKGPNMNLPHYGHKQFSLKNGSIIIVDLNGVELYSPLTNKFELFKDTLYERFNRIDNNSNWKDSVNITELKTGNILVTGGVEYLYPPGTSIPDYKIISKAEVIDPVAKKIYEIDNMKYPRAHHSSIVLPSGDVLLISGIKDLKQTIKERRFVLNDTIERFSPKTKTFTTLSTTITPSFNPFVYYLNNNLIIFDGPINPQRGDNLKNGTYQIINLQTLEQQKKEYNEKLWLDNFHSKMFQVNESEFLSFYYLRNKNEFLSCPSITSLSPYITYIDIKNNNYLKIKSKISPNSNIIKLSENKFLITGGNRYKDSLYTKVLKCSFSSNYNLYYSDFYINTNDLSLPNSYIIRIIKNNRGR